MQQLKLSGLKLGDVCAVVSPMGPKRKITLNRTCWDIVPASDEGRGGQLIAIPGAKPRSFHWRLELVPVLDETRFLLRSMDGTPFSLNGQWSRESFIEQHDTLGFENPARLEFAPSEKLKTSQENTWPEILRDERMVTSQLPILLQGETGTGKSHLAQEIHRRSARLGPLVSLNIASLASGLVEAELFGHKRGSFTGAHADRRGVFSQALNGTLFLDEIDSLSLELQTKLLLVLDHGRFRAVGGEREERTNARLIFAAGRDLVSLVQRGSMRADFYYRLTHGAMVELKPLRNDPQLITQHCQGFALDHQVVISERLLDFYRTLPWPGNLRQLRGHLSAKKVRSKTRKLDFDCWDEKLLTMPSDLIHLAHEAHILPMDEVKRRYARRAFQQCHGELSLTARELKVNPKTLKLWLQEN
jgi:DNA-binding NtrC family response regulator